MRNWSCVSCKRRNEDRAAYCIYCGAKRQAEWECAVCHETNLPQALFCMSCGLERRDIDSWTDNLDENDELLPQAVEISVEAGLASVSMLQRRLRITYARAGGLIDEMAARGIVEPGEGAKPRKALITREQCKLMFDD